MQYQKTMHLLNLLDIKEVSRLLKVKPVTLYAWASRGKIPCLKINGLVRFDQDQLNEWMHTLRKQPPRPRALRRCCREGGADVDALIANARREAYTSSRGETRRRSGLIRKEETDGAR